MFDIGWSELMVIGVVALVVIGPKDLPQAIYTLGKWVRKARLVARDFQGHIDDMMREAELDDLRRQALKARDLHLGDAIDKAVDPDGRLKHVFDLEVKDTSGMAGSVGAGMTGMTAEGMTGYAGGGMSGHAGSPPETDPLPALATPDPSLPPVPAQPPSDAPGKAVPAPPAPDKTA